MRHRKAGLKLNRTSSHRKAMFRNMVTSLFKHEKIRTTDVKAKELRRWADNLITLAKRGDLHARRQALAIIMEKDIVHKLFENAAERYGSISGGYTRIVKLGRRRGDAAPISLVELITSETTKKKKKKKAKPVAEKKQVVETKVIDKEVPQDKEEAKVAEEIKEKKAAEKPTAPVKPEETEAKKPKAKVTKAEKDDTAAEAPKAKVTKAKKDDTAAEAPKPKATKAKKDDPAAEVPKPKATKAKKDDTEPKE